MFLKVVLTLLCKNHLSITTQTTILRQRTIYHKTHFLTPFYHFILCFSLVHLMVLHVSLVDEILKLDTRKDGLYIFDNDSQHF